MQTKILRVLLLVICLSALSSAAVIFDGRFTDAFAPGNWTLTNDNGGDGYIMPYPPSGVSIFGADNGVSGNNTVFSILAPATGTVDVTWRYVSFDVDGPSFDPGGYWLNGVFTQLTNSGGPDGQSGTISFAVTSGDTFGFGIFSSDGVEGRGEITIVPEPAAGALCMSALAGLWLVRRFRRLKA